MSIEVREVTGLQVREAEGGEWTVEGVAVPWDQPTFIGGGYREQFARGAFSDYAGGATLYAAHGHLRGDLPIGRITALEEREDGAFISARISQTSTGRDAYTLLRDGVVDRFSIGFEPVEQETRSDDSGDVVVRTKARLREVSIVGMPAYENAAVTAVRSHESSEVRSEANPEEESTMDDFAPKADLIEARQEIEDLSRRFDTLKNGVTSPLASQPIKVRSIGELLKMSVTGQRDEAREQAELIHRAYTGATTTDNAGARPAWLDRDLKQIAQKRDVLEFFIKEALPATGLSFTYPVFGAVTGDVAVQSAEGADLTYMEISTTTGTATVSTYGAYSSVTRQIIERQDVSYINALLLAQRNSYAKVTNGAVRTLLSTTPTAYNQGTVAFANRADPSAWLSAMANACADIAQNSVGLTAGAWVMGRTQALQLALLKDGQNRPVFVLNGDGVNSIGNTDLRTLKINVGGMPVLVDYGLTGTDSYIASAEAITVLEDGAKYLQDDNIINLTKDFSIYGYLALTKNDVKGITRITHPTS
jgi:HK97 family phage prohead protease/HK97 family phage major capsid protein